MAITCSRQSVLLALACLCVAPASAFAQSTLTGVVKDTSGAVLPGVTVEAASPVLIEKMRSAVTDSTGSYRIVDLRPGVYTLTFTLTGFSIVKREAIELPANFTMTINGDLKVGALEETLTVTGAAPTVDVQSTTKAQVLNRDALDAIPTGRTIQGMGQLITGVSLNIPDVGGSRAMQQTYMSTHGLGASQTTVQVDGLLVNGLDGDGAVQNYFNSSMSQEMVYTTSGAGADVSGGGVRLNMIPRDGGNRFSGTVFSGYQDLSFQSDNLTSDLKARGLKTPDGIDKLWNIEGSLGGPIKKDKMWFFGSARAFHLNTLPADALVGIPGTALANRAPTPSTERGIDPQKINSFQARIVWQISPNTKLSAYNDRLLKNRGSDMIAGVDPATASGVWASPLYTTGEVKVSSTVTSHLLVEGGFSLNIERYTILNQPGISQTPGTPAWYTGIQKSDSALGTTWNFSYGGEDYGRFPDRYAMAGSVSYITGTHNVKVGIQDTWGSYRRTDTANGDIRAVFLNGVATTATILNSPVERFDQVHGDVGVYAQDSWTLKRLTVNYGAQVRAPRDRHPGRDGAGRPVHRGAHVRAHRHADMEQLFATRRARLRRVWQPEDGRQVQHRPVRAGRDHRVLGKLQPAAAGDGERLMDRPERRRRPSGGTWMQVSDARLRNQPRTVADRLRRGQPGELRPEHPADVQRRDVHQPPAGVASGRVGAGWVVPPRLP